MDLSKLPPEVAAQMAGLVTGPSMNSAPAKPLKGFSITTAEGFQLEGEVEGAELDLLVTAPTPEGLQLGLVMQLAMAARLGAKIEQRT